MIIAMAGQPNSGKSTLFNQVAGYKTVTSNFPGKTVKYTKTTVRFSGEVMEIVDLPGTYSLTSFDLAEVEARKYLLKKEADVVVNVVDASLLSRSLELTIQITELDVPMVLCLNMMDEAERKGIHIDTGLLEDILGMPVVPAVAVKGKGIREVFQAAIETAQTREKPKKIEYSRDIEEVVQTLERKLEEESHKLKIPSRLLSLKLLENDHYFLRYVTTPQVLEMIKEYQGKLEDRHGKPSDVVISSERHAQAMNIFEQAATVTEPEISMRDRLDDVLMHKYLGYISLGVILYVFFNVVFGAGQIVESYILDLFESVIPHLSLYLGGISLKLVEGLIEGFAGGVGIVLPYLVPFLIGLAILEDIGYLPRIAFLMDTFLHRIGLHGKAIIPVILGYGCTVPAVMATRILESDRDRFITAAISTMIPCAARTTIILGLVAFFISANAALVVYIFNLAVIVVLGLILSRFMPEITPGLILEMPSYHVPSVRSVLLKTWLRVREFIYIAWPFLIGGSILLSFMNYVGLDSYVNTILSPLTLLLGLPTAVGVTLVFGILKKELSLVMLMQALGTSRLLEVLTTTQILTFTVFVIFYIPCVATLGVLAREFGAKRMGYITVMTTGVAVLLALLVRVGGMIL
ncbi:MAG: ferrous iron transport protein B [Theionarchaea archaeon]|nr:MAG: ferrous iron transporter B [Theionarchaea archaeon DG-70-1]MBU7027577.1 ferrous iron transport protein B [Theionarchaea archaeon]